MLMKKFIPIVFLVLFVSLSPAYPVDDSHKSLKRIDLPTKKIMSELASGSEISAGKYLNVLMKVSGEFDKSKAENAGVRFGTEAGKIFTANVPVSYLETLAASEGVVYIDGGKLLQANLDSARKITGADKVHSGNSPLPRALSGKGVVVGIIDAGFDYTHPAFTDENGECRIRRVWEQFREGTAPAGYSYGNNLTSPEEIANARNDLGAMSHGTHVAGIITGRSIPGSAENYYGLAPDADIVIVALKPPSQEEWKNASLGDMIDGINYIYRYADSVGKPAVVNLSWGGHCGPHDGTSLFSQAQEELVGSGKIFCVSAGNDGDTKLHLRKTFSSSADTLRSFVLHQYDKSSAKNGIWLDVWGEQGKDFSASFGIFNYADKSDFYNSGYIATTQDTTIEYQYVAGGDTCNVSIMYETCAYNGKPHAFAEFSGNKAFRISLGVTADEGTVDAWNWYLVDYYGIISNFSSMSIAGASAGDSALTLSDLATGRNAIAVGAFVTKNNYTSVSGVPYSFNYVVGKKAYFTSNGPSADGRIKPDISAPGMMLCSSVNNYDSTYYEGKGNRINVVSADSDSTHEILYAMMSGTSMSSPFVSGTIALLLEAKPDLTPAEIINLLSETADTTELSSTGLPDNVYGHGKINTFLAVLKLLTGSGVSRSISHASVYPNPFNDFATVEGDFPVGSEIVVFSAIDGKEIYRAKADCANRTELHNLKFLPVGAYYFTVQSSGKIISLSKCLKSK